MWVGALSACAQLNQYGVLDFFLVDCAGAHGPLGVGVAGFANPVENHQIGSYWKNVQAPGFSCLESGGYFTCQLTQTTYPQIFAGVVTATYCPDPQCVPAIPVMSDHYVIIEYIGAKAAPQIAVASPECRPCTRNLGNPADIITGELWYHYFDFKLSGPFGLEFSHFYDNQSSFNGDLGFGWRHTYDANLDTSQQASTGQVIYYNNEDMPTYFVVAKGNSANDNYGGGTLALNSAGSLYTMTTWQGMVYTFDSSGRLLTLADRVGNTQTISRDSGHAYRISSVSDSLGRTLSFGYDASNRITSVTSSPAGISLAMVYDTGTNCGTGNLCSVAESDGKTWSYQYDYTNPTYPHNLLEVLDPNGNANEVNTYTGNKLATQYTGNSSASPQPNYLSFNYLDSTDTLVSDSEGNSTSYTFDANLKVITSIQGGLCRCGGDKNRSYTYDTYLRVTSIKDGDGNTHKVTLVYGRDVTRTNADGSKTVIRALPGPTQIVEPLSSGVNRTTNITYYPVGDSRQDLPNIITLPSADTPGNLLTITDTYSAQGLLLSEASKGYIGGVSTTYTTSFQYDSKGRLQQVTGPRTDLLQKTVLAYYPDTDTDLARRGQLHTITDALSHITTFASAASPNNTYNIYGGPLSVTDPNSVQLTLAYDPRGRTNTRTIAGVSGDPTPLTTTYAYDGAGRRTSVTFPLGNGLGFGYDSSDRLTSVTRLASNGYQEEQVVYGYYPSSMLNTEQAQVCGTPAATCSSWSTTQQETFKHDGYYRPSEVDHPTPANSKIAYAYDNAGNLTTIKDENHSSANMTYAYDYANRPISLTQTLTGAPGNQIVTQYGYDVQDNVNSVTDPNGNTTTYNNDDFARVRTENSPVSGLSTYAYDPADNLTSFTDANAATTTSTFDALDRILSATSVRSGYSNDVVSWTYDDATSGHFGIGRVATMTDPTGSMSYTYERRGLLKTEARTVLGNLYNLAYGYDYNGNRNSLTYPDTSVVAYTFDWADRPISATSGANHFVTSANYEPFGPLTQLVFGNGSKQTFSFDQRYRPTEDKLVNGATTIADYSYAEDSVGNITQIHDSTNAAYNRDFAYDDLNRLTTANSGSSLWGTLSGNGYTYDLMGNLKTIQLGSGRTASFAYSGTTPRLTSVTENGTPRSVGYDSTGNETTVGSATYAYTPRNVLSSGDGLSYVTDGWGRREVSTTSTGSRYSFYGPDMTLLSESNVTTGTPTVAYDYVWFGGRPIAQTDSTGVHYTVADHLGTPLLQTDSSSNVYFRMEQEPYGKVWALRAGDVHQPLRLPGQEAEQFDTGANGLTERSYNNFRWYRPGWGRYSQADPIGLAGGVDVYGYVSNNPAARTDPSGAGAAGTVIGGTLLGTVAGTTCAVVLGAGGAAGGTLVEPGGGTFAGGAGGVVVGGLLCVAATVPAGCAAGSSVEDLIRDLD